MFWVWQKIFDFDRVFLFLAQISVLPTKNTRGGWGYLDKWGYPDNLC